MNERPDLRRSVPARVGLVALCALAIVLVAALIGIASVGLAAVFTGAGKPTGWEQINEAFGVVNSVFSALALIVVGLRSDYENQIKPESGPTILQNCLEWITENGVRHASGGL
jgi:hypothetical protein